MKTWQKNIIATMPGRVTPSKVIIVGAHYDSRGKNGDSMVSAPGADDNGSGTAAVLEMARVTKQSGFRPQSTMKFVAFAAEELITLGSQDYARKAKASQMDVRLMINLDVVSYSTLDLPKSRVGVYLGDTTLIDVFGVKTALNRFSVLPPIYYGHPASDDQSFMNVGFPSIGFLEDKISPFHHSPQDVDSNYNYEYCAEVTKAAFAVALAFADKGATVRNLRIGYTNDASNLVLRWSLGDSINIKNYRVYVGRTLGIYEKVFTCSDTTFVLRDVSGGTTYYVAVAPIDDQNNEGIPVEISFIPQRVIPPAFRLFENYPNPFNATTNIMFDVPMAGTVSLKVFDSLGREITGLIDGRLDPGRYSLQWGGKDYASGLYFLRMQSGKFVQTRKMLLLK